jgi:CheY-like chemotaxis protein
VLVVDDNKTNRRILEELLGSWRMKVTAAESAAAALATMRNAVSVQRPFDLVLTDAMMPGVDGFTLARQIAADRALSHAKVIMLTSAGGVTRRTRGLEQTIVSQLTKPVKQSDLMDAILDALAGVVQCVPEKCCRVAQRAATRRLRVLVAEDNATNQKLVELLLEQQRHRVTTVTNGRQAVDASARQRFDVILMDVQMPDMDGFEATAAIRERERSTGAHTPIIAMTAHAMAGDRERCLAAGMDAYVSKPLRVDDLMDAIAHFFPSPAGAAAVDQMETALLADFGGNRKVLSEVIGVFLSDAPGYVERLRRAAASNDAAALAAAAHALKGSVGLFAKGAAYEAALAFERAAKEGDAGNDDARMHDLDVAVRHLCGELEAVRKGLSSS